MLSGNLIQCVSLKKMLMSQIVVRTMHPKIVSLCSIFRKKGMIQGAVTNFQTDFQTDWVSLCLQFGSQNFQTDFSVTTPNGLLEVNLDSRQGEGIQQIKILLSNSAFVAIEGQENK